MINILQLTEREREREKEREISAKYFHLAEDMFRLRDL